MGNKSIITFGLWLFSLFIVNGQGIPIQLSVMDEHGIEKTNTQVNLRLTLQNDTAVVTGQYQEIHNLFSDEFGIVSALLGEGIVTTNSQVLELKSFAFSTEEPYLQIELDTSIAQNNYNLIGYIRYSYPLLANRALISDSSTYALSSDTSRYSNLSDTADYLAMIDPGWYSDSSNTNELELPANPNTGDLVYWNNTEWVTVASGSEGQILGIFGGVPTWQDFTNGSLITTDVYNPITGEIWMDRNLGSSQSSVSSTDTASYGSLYQWGRNSDGHESRTSMTTNSTWATSSTPTHGDFILNSSSPFDWVWLQQYTLWQGVNGNNNPCPTGYRIPTKAEWQAELASWGTSNSAGAINSPLALSLTGWRSASTGSLVAVGTEGWYWSSTMNSIYSEALKFTSTTASIQSSERRVHGYAVRCIKH